MFPWFWFWAPQIHFPWSGDVAQRTDILTAFERRIGNDKAGEFREALDQVHKIARLRLQAMATQ